MVGYQSNLNIKLCLDFSERKFHIGGVLGEKMLEKLIHEGKCQLTQDRQIILKTDLNNLMKVFISKLLSNFCLKLLVVCCTNNLLLI